MGARCLARLGNRRNREIGGGEMKREIKFRENPELLEEEDD